MHQVGFRYTDVSRLPGCIEMHGQQNIKSKYMQLYGISFMHPYKQSGRWQDVLDTRPAALPK